MKTVAMMGLGAMGSRMAERLLKAGYPLVVYNRTQSKANTLVEQGAIWALTPREAVEKADIVFSMVTDDEASQAIWTHPETGGLLGLISNKIVIESSTLTPSWIQQLQSKVQETGATFMDAPVAGSRPQAEQGILVFLVGGSEETVQEMTPIFEVMGGAILPAGPTGSGSSLKLAVNVLFGVQIAAFSEMLGLLERSGFARDIAIEMLGKTPVVSPALKGASGLIAANKFAAMFPIDLVEKDFRYAVQTAERLGTTAPVAEATRRAYQAAQEAGLGGLNIVGVAKLYQP